MGNYSPREAVPAPENLTGRLSEVGAQIATLYALNGQCHTRFDSAADAIAYAHDRGVVSSEYHNLIDVNRRGNAAKHGDV